MPHLLKALRDPLWQFLGVATTLVVSYLGIRIGATRRSSIMYHVDTSPLITVESTIKGHVQILFDGHPVSDVHLLTMKIANVGETVVRSSDYEMPIALTLPDITQLLSAEVLDARPADAAPEITINNNRVILSPTLLNPGDWVRVRVLTHGRPATAEVSARIAGVSSLREDTGLSYRRKDFVRSFFQDIVIVVGGLLLVNWAESWALILPASAVTLVGAWALSDFFREFRRYWKYRWL